MQSDLPKLYNDSYRPGIDLSWRNELFIAAVLDLFPLMNLPVVSDPQPSFGNNCSTVSEPTPASFSRQWKKAPLVRLGHQGTYCTHAGQAAIFLFFCKVLSAQDNMTGALGVTGSIILPNYQTPDWVWECSNLAHPSLLSLGLGVVHTWPDEKLKLCRREYGLAASGTYGLLWLSRDTREASWVLYGWILLHSNWE